MRASIVVFACAVLLAHAPADAGLITVPVSGMSGDYSEPGGVPIERSASFTFNPTITNITEVRVKLTGVHVRSSQSCNSLPWLWNFHFLVEIYDSVPGTGHSIVAWPDVDGAFIETRRVGTIGVTDWSFLLDGTAHIRIVGDPSAGQDCTPLGPPPEAALATVEVEIFGDVTTPVETSTWGQIKALYR